MNIKKGPRPVRLVLVIGFIGSIFIHNLFTEADFNGIVADEG